MKTNGYPLIVSDFDGTLLRSDETIADETLLAIEQYKSSGGHFALCTGRMLSSALSVAKSLGLSGLVACFQGSVVADIVTEKLIVDGYIPTAGAVEICRFLEEQNLHYHAYDTYKYYSNKDDEWLHVYERIVRVKAEVIDSQPLSEFVKQQQLKARKLLILLNPDDRTRVYQALEQRFGKDYYVTYSSNFLVEITNKDYSKATALEKIADYYGVSVDDTVAVGDSLNDLPMIVRAGLGIAVNNAEAALKEAADVTLECSNDENAIGEIIKRYGF